MGILEYSKGLPLQVIIGIACAVVVVCVVIIITVYCVIKKRREKSGFGSKPFDNDYNEVDWPYEQRIHLPPSRPELDDGMSTTASKFRSVVGANLRVGAAGMGKGGDTIASRNSSMVGKGTVVSRGSSKTRGDLSERDSGMSAEGDDRLSDKLDMDDDVPNVEPEW
jgi:hypothetical protein